jgi:hypothetical protein
MPYLPIAAAVVVATAIGLLVTVRKDHSAVETRATPSISTPQAHPSAPVVFSVLLTPGATRGGGEFKRLTIPPGTDLIQLQLDLEGDRHPIYAATLKTTSGTQVWEQAGLNSQSDGSVLCRVPASVFKSGSYELALAAASGSSSEVVAYYYFQVFR